MILSLRLSTQSICKDEGQGLDAFLPRSKQAHMAS
jgi:hypothetical protein